ncbi:MAG: putative peptidoglycan glycosyltransferase FtsW [Actinomycetota bacterium]|nr:putative peptidoglycan glycosyltransferase FtsW [Actinomycetota bacterium]
MAKVLTRILQPFPRGDRAATSLLVLTALMVGYGTVMVGSASDAQSALNGGTSFALAIRDLMYLAIGAIVFWLVARVRLSWLVGLAPVLVSIGLALLMGVEMVGITVNGGKRWLPTPFIQIQPSEFFKLIVVLYVVWVIQHHHRRIGNWQHLALWMSPVLAGVGLILLEHDVGTDTVVVAIALMVLFVAGLPRKVVGAIVLLGLPVIGTYAALEPYSVRRLISFLHPNANLATTGYQLLQSRIGLGAGGLTGLGLDHSREKWGLLPNPHTDFIFTIIGEELGLIGTLSVIALFVGFLMAATRIARQCTNEAYRLLVVGITVWIVLEAVINIASVVGFWAVTGIPLPFFSYGGTALITELAAVGLLYNVAHDRSRGEHLDIDATEPGFIAVAGSLPPSRPVRPQYSHRGPLRAPRS